MSDWIIDRNVERFKSLLAADLDDTARATITKLLQLERAKTPRLLPRTDA